ncbi:putative lysosomal acid lipase/cholesteryl ester hydrolase [Ixodes scapularis]
MLRCYDAHAKRAPTPHGPGAIAAPPQLRDVKPACFVLADNGYDVWMGNTRGGTFGKLHVNMTPKSKSFWNFSFHEHGVYDAPAQIDRVLDKTRRDCLLYVGFSQGSLMFFVMVSQRPEYDAKKAARSAHLERLGSGGVLSAYLSRVVCSLPARTLCGAEEDAAANLGSKYVNTTRYPVYVCSVPAGTSVKNLLHFWQFISSKKAQLFDYGPKQNRKVYGQLEPPLYGVDSLKTDVGVFWSLGDRLVSREDVEELVQELGSRLKKKHYVDDADYMHLNFVLSVNNHQLLHPDLLEFLGRYVGKGCRLHT